MDLTTTLPIAPSAGAAIALESPQRADAALQKPDAAAVAKEFEKVFLTEMLKHAGLGKPLQSFGGGVGEAAFSDFLTEEWAQMMVDGGGLGVAKAIEAAIAGEGDADV